MSFKKRSVLVVDLSFFLLFGKYMRRLELLKPRWTTEDKPDRRSLGLNEVTLNFLVLEHFSRIEKWTCLLFKFLFLRVLV